MPTTPTPGTDFWEQPALEQERSADSATVTVRYAGDYDAVSAYAASFSVGTAHPTMAGYELTKVVLERYEGPSGRLTLVYSDVGDDASSSPKARVKKVSWSLATTPCDVPIWRYCGPSDQNARRYRLEPWSQEQDADLKKQWKWRDPYGGLQELQANDQKLGAKILKGYETVQRHFPTIRKVTSLTKGEVEPDGSLDYVGDPTDAPDYFVTRATQWLKVGEQIDIAENGSQTLTEEWIGGEEFDANFYGDGNDRWEFGTV